MEIPFEFELAGPRVRLTSLQIDSIYTHFAWNNDPELHRLDSEVPFHQESFGEFKKRFERLLASRDPSSRDFEVQSEDGTVIGVAYISRLSIHNKHCSISLTIGDRAYWGRGYGRECMNLLMAYCFDGLGMHRVTAEVFAYNDAWKRLVEGMGFSREGVDRDYLFREGEFHDRIRYGILADEYRAAGGRNGARTPRPKSSAAA